MEFPSDMPWYFKVIQATIDFTLGLVGKNPDKPKDDEEK